MSLKMRPMMRSGYVKALDDFMEELKVPKNLRADVLDAYKKLMPAPGKDEKAVSFKSQVGVTIAALVLILDLEQPGVADHPEYMRLRAIAQELYEPRLNPDGYASQFGGEPEFYGIANALLVKMFEVYGEKEKEVES